MIFSELYSAYYNTVAAILTKALDTDITEKQLQREVLEKAFSESTLTILPALKSGKWQLLDSELIPVINEAPTMPLTTLQKRWLKSLADDPRLRLFDVQLPDFEDVQPLFTREDYRIYDKYDDGDPFGDETYIRNFRLILSAIRQKRAVKVTLPDRKGEEMWVRMFPEGLEYSEKEDKIRILATGCRFRRFNLAKLTSCGYYNGGDEWSQHPVEEEYRELTLLITDERNALQRVMLHFAHFEKQAERIDDIRYKLRLRYSAGDETELVIRTLSFGPCVKVLEPRSFVELIKERLISQKICGLK